MKKNPSLPSSIFREKWLRKQKLKRALLGLPITVLCIGQPVFAETEQRADKKERSKIQMIKVIGQATSGLDSEITGAKLDKVHANDLNDIFRSDPTVTSGGSVGMSQKIYVRNVGEDILNITIDGAEQANAVFHHSGRISIEPELLKRVEVEAGAGSATAGPGALGGAVRFTTKDPEDLLKPGQHIGGMIKTGYHSNGDSNKLNATVFGRDKADRFSALLSITDSEQDNVEDGNGDEIIGTESEQTLGFGKVVMNISDAQYLSISYENLEEEGEVLYRPEWIASDFNVSEPTEGERETVTLNYGFSSDSNPLLDVAVTLYNTEYRQAREFAGPSFDGAVESTGLTLQNTSRFLGHELVYGINYRDDKSYLNDIDFAPNSYFEETGEVKGVYIQDVITLGERLTLSTGLRFDDYEVDDVNGQHFSDSGVSPNLSANFEIKPGLSVSAGYAEAFRGVEVEDSFRLSSSTYDASLQAEEAKNIELGLDYQKGQFYAGLGLYRTVIEDLILRNPPWSNVVTNLEDDVEIEGYFLSMGYASHQFGIAAKYLSSDAEVDGEKATRYVYGSKATSIGDTLTIDAHYNVTPKLEAGWIAEFVNGIDNIRQNVGGDSLIVDKPGYSVHNIYIEWFPLKDDRLAINVSVNNLFDKQYLSHASIEDYQNNEFYDGIAGSAEAGRDIRLSAKFKF